MRYIQFHLRLNVQFLRTGACAKRVHVFGRKYVYAGRTPSISLLNRGMRLSAIVAMTCEGVIGVYKKSLKISLLPHTGKSSNL